MVRGGFNKGVLSQSLRLQPIVIVSRLLALLVYRSPGCLAQWTLKAKARFCKWAIGFLQERLVQNLLERIPNLFGS